MPLQIRPIAGVPGAGIHGVDLATEVSPATVSAVRQALPDHLVIFFRDQDITPA